MCKGGIRARVTELQGCRLWSRPGKARHCRKNKRTEIGLLRRLGAARPRRGRQRHRRQQQQEEGGRQAPGAHNCTHLAA